MKYDTDNHLGRIANDGELILPDLPPIDTVRWFAGRKARVVAAVQAGALSVSQACRRYGLSPEELREWERRYETGELGRPRFVAQPRRLH